jgi:hypothetical protein
MSEWGGKRQGAGRPRGSRSPHVKARQEAVQEIVARFVADHPNAFPGDSVALLQCIYKNPDLPLELRMDPASKCARFERPVLMAAAVQNMSPVPASSGELDLQIESLIRKGLAHVTIDAG